MFPSKCSLPHGYLKLSLISTISLLFAAHVFVVLQNVSLFFSFFLCTA